MSVACGILKPPMSNITSGDPLTHFPGEHLPDDGRQIAELIESCRTGDQQSWAALVRMHEAEVGRQMWRFSRDPSVRQELVQDVFVELYYSLGKFRWRGVPFEHWLKRIATRVGYQYWKKQARNKNVALAEDYRDSAPGPVDEMEASDAGRFLHTLLAQLLPKDRLVLTLAYLEELGTAEIAERTGWNRGLVKVRLMRARRRLQQIVEENHLHEAIGSAK
jgi:RNA polymerase sigma-70 factor (ECF subfamily)